ncbi:hypothetical protein K7432_015281 [Basidiobolus ranarum]|uniref:Phosphotyrosine protein phosphatase I domain-containing protein n=1 Tax=Basidiobolus ranarum TaxID=34480 RepID=A0ABR2WGB7_9FUNG
MAEGLAIFLGGVNGVTPVFDLVSSAALEGLADINPDAKLVMSNIGVDISSHYSKMIDSFSPQDFDIVISMCGCGGSVIAEWREGKRFEDWNVLDPTGYDVDTFITVRNEIESRVKELIRSIIEQRPPTYSLYTADRCSLSL